MTKMTRYMNAIKRRIDPRNVKFIMNPKRMKFFLQFKCGFHPPMEIEKETNNRPNIILVSIDSLRADHLGCYGYQKRTTPNIDKFADSGLVFENTICQAPWTKPSVGSMLTSLYPGVHGADTKGEYGDDFASVKVPQKVSVLNPHAKTLAEILKENGYVTAGFTGGGYTHSFFGFSKGFDHYHDSAGGIKTINYEIFDFLKKKRDKPFFIFTHFFDAHYPFKDIPPYNKMFGKYDSKVNVDRQFEIEVNSGKRKLHDEDIQRLISLYNGGIFYCDEQLQILFSILQKFGCYDNTIIVITSDHGEGFMEHDLIAHADIMYNELMKIPLIIRWPSLGNSKRIKYQVRSIDIMPTILDFIGVAPPSEIHGVSLYPIINNEENTDRIAFSETERMGFQKVVMDGRYKLLFNCTTREEKLFDYISESGEKTDIKNKNSTKFEDLKMALEGWNSKLKTDTEKFEGNSKDEEKVVDDLIIEQLKGLGYL